MRFQVATRAIGSRLGGWQRWVFPRHLEVVSGRPLPDRDTGHNDFLCGVGTTWDGSQLRLPIVGGQPMTPAEHFRRHANECRQAARAAPSRESRAMWMKLAERWEFYTALQERRSASPPRRP